MLKSISNSISRVFVNVGEARSGVGHVLDPPYTQRGCQALHKIYVCKVFCAVFSHTTHTHTHTLKPSFLCGFPTHAVPSAGL